MLLLGLMYQRSLCLATPVAKMTVDTNATIAKKDYNVIESVQDGKIELLRDVSSSATNSMTETLSVISTRVDRI